MLAIGRQHTVGAGFLCDHYAGLVPLVGDMTGAGLTKRVLVLGFVPSLLDDFRRQLDMPDVEFVGGTGVDDVRSAFAQGDLDHVMLGGGLDLRTRLEVARVVFESSDKATVHLKDHLSGPEGFVPFVGSVLRGLSDYEPRLSPRAILRAQRSGQVTEG